MSSSGVVTQHLFNLISKQVDDYGIVVWYDPEGVYTSVLPALQLPGTTVLCYEDSFIKLRWELDQKHLLDCDLPPRLMVYVPIAQKKTHHALIELEEAGVVMQPGQQPPARNTRLAVVARNALKATIGEENAAKIERQTEAGKLSLADLEALAEKGHIIFKGVLALIFGTSNPQELVLFFLDNDQIDESIVKKDAIAELVELLRRDFGFDAPDGIGLKDIRQRLARHILMTEFISGLGELVPRELSSVPVASSPAETSACVDIARSWRMRRDRRDSYVAVARFVEKELKLGIMNYELEAMLRVETFPSIEKGLVRYAENRLLEQSDGGILALAESRLSSFWCDAEPKLQARWALVASSAEVLLQADRVETALKRSPTTVTGMIKEYSEGAEPWCLLDTHHRRMESRWHNFESHGDDNDSIEKLVIQARRRYVEVGSELAQKFLKLLTENLPDKSVARQREIFEKRVKPHMQEKKTAYVWVDALRYEMGLELARLFSEDVEVDIHPAIAAVPTVTEIGMAALLPGAQGDIKIVDAGNGKLAMEIDGTVIKDRKDRVTHLKKHAGVEVYDTKLDHLLPKPSKNVREGIKNARLILVTSQEIDELCEQDNITQARRQMDGVMHDLHRGVRILADMGIEHIVLAADHGHVFADELSEDMKIDPPGGKTVDLHRRVWVGQGGKADDAFLRMPLAALGMQSDYDIATPWSFACFRSKGGAKAYFHGGLSPQELLIPVMNLRPLAKPSSGSAVGILWKLVPGSEKLTTRFFSAQITGFYSGLFDIVLPKIRLELRARGRVISQAVSASYGFEEATGDVALRYEEASSKKIASNTVTLMIIEEPDQKSVGLYLLDAATGAELARLEKIEVAIAM